MTKAYLKFDPGPAPPLFEFGPNQFDSRPPGYSKDPTASSVKGRHVVWKGLRRFGRRAILLACARNVSSVVFCGILLGRIKGDELSLREEEAYIRILTYVTCGC